MDPEFGGEENLYSEAGFPAGNFVASTHPNLPTFPAPLRGHIAQCFAICLRTPSFLTDAFFGVSSLRRAQGTVFLLMFIIDCI